MLFRSQCYLTHYVTNSFNCLMAKRHIPQASKRICHVKGSACACVPIFDTALAQQPNSHGFCIAVDLLHHLVKHRCQILCVTPLTHAKQGHQKQVRFLTGGIASFLGRSGLRRMRDHSRKAIICHVPVETTPKTLALKTSPLSAQTRGQ